jgi:hypothetical protein
MLELNLTLKQSGIVSTLAITVGEITVMLELNLTVKQSGTVSALTITVG